MSFSSEGLLRTQFFNLARLSDVRMQSTVIVPALLASFVKKLVTAACQPTSRSSSAVGISLRKLDVLTTAVYLITVLRMSWRILSNIGTQLNTE
jgi:hypothetical protein